MPADSPRPRFLFVLQLMGTLDHPVALWRQLVAAGAHADFAIGEPGLELPEWVSREVPGLTLIDDPLEAVAERRYDAVIMQTPYDHMKSDAWRTLGPEQAFMVYSGYSVWIAEWDEGAHGLAFFERCSLVLASSQFEKASFEHSEYPPLAVTWSGDPLMWEAAHAPAPESSASRILWTPHWTEKWVDGSPGFASWKTTVHDVLAVARRRPEATFVVRRHPLFKIEGDDAQSRRAAKAFRQLEDLPNVEYSDSSMMRDMAESTAHLTDGVGIIAYYAMFGKPQAVIRLKRRWPPYNAAGKAIVNTFDSLYSSRDVRRWLHRAASGTALTSPGGAELTSQIFPLQDVSPGQVLIDIIEARRAAE
jgi:hypothetical protein